MAAMRSYLWWIVALIVVLSGYWPASAAVFSASARSESAERTTTGGGAPSELSAFLTAIHAAGALVASDGASHRLPSQMRKSSTITDSVSERRTPVTEPQPAGFVVLDQDLQGRDDGSRDVESQDRPTHAPYRLSSFQGAPRVAAEAGVVSPGVTVTSNRTGGSTASVPLQPESVAYSSTQPSSSASRASVASTVATDWEQQNTMPPQQRYYRGIPIASQMRLVEVLGGAALTTGRRSASKNTSP